MFSFSTRNQPELLAAACDFTRSTGFAADAHAIGIFRDGQLVGTSVMQHADGQGVDTHNGGEPSVICRRDVMSTLARYYFLVRKHRTVRFPIAAWNVQAQIACLKSGAFISGIIRGGALDGSDAIILTVTSDTFRWLPRRPVEPQPQPKPAEED